MRVTSFFGCFWWKCQKGIAWPTGAPRNDRNRGRNQQGVKVDMGLLHAAGSDELTFHAAPERAKAHIGNSPETADEKKKKFAWMPLRDYLLLKTLTVLFCNVPLAKHVLFHVELTFCLKPHPRNTAQTSNHPSFRFLMMLSLYFILLCTSPSIIFGTTG